MADKCEQIRTEIGILESLIDSIDDQLENTRDPKIGGELRRQRKLFFSALQQRKTDLESCTAEPETPPLQDPRIFGSEVTQGLSGYELVAGKDTLARVFVGRRPDLVLSVVDTSDSSQYDAARAMHFDLPPFDRAPFFGSRLDFAALRITGPNGLDIEVAGDLGDGLFSNFTKRFSEDDNVNFYIEGRQLPAAGQYSFDARFYRNGQLVGTHALGRHRFFPTKDLRLLIVVDTWPMPTAAWNTLFESLNYVHRNFPVRAGIGPLDGDQTAGLRYLIDPVPFDPDFPGWMPVRQRLDAFNAQQQSNGKSDRAEHILTVRVQQDFEGPLGGVGESGPGGRVSGVTLNVNPPADDVFATLICQEIGHNFLGSAHTPDPSIAEPAAFNLLDREAIGSPRSIMFGSYTGNRNTDSLFLPADWNKIRAGLMDKNATGTG